MILVNLSVQIISFCQISSNIYKLMNLQFNQQFSIFQHLPFSYYNNFMNGYLSFVVLFFILQIHKIQGFVRVSTHATFNMSTSTVGIIHVMLANTGQIAYVSMNDTDGYTKIKSYNVSTGTFIQQRTSMQPLPQNIYPNYIMIYANYLLVCVQTNNNYFLAFYYSNGGYYTTYYINQHVMQFIQISSLNIVFYYTDTGNVYWIAVANFPNGDYKHTILLGLSGKLKVRLSPNSAYLAIGCQLQSKLYLINVTSQLLLYTYELNITDTRVMSWKSDSSELYVVTGSQGLVHVLLPVSPFTVTSYRYEQPSVSVPYHLEYFSSSNDLAIWSQKSSSSEILIYSFNLTSQSVVHKQPYNSSLVSVAGSNFDKALNEYFVEWSTNEILVKRLHWSCQAGDYYDDYLGKCSFCSASCTNCTSEGCGTRPVVVNVTNGTVVDNTTNDVIDNSTIVDNTTIVDNSTVSDNSTNNNTLPINTTDSNSTDNSTIVDNTTVIDNSTTVDNSTAVDNSTNTPANVSDPSETNITTPTNTTTDPPTNITDPTNDSIPSNSTETTDTTIPSPQQQSTLYTNFQALLDNTLNSPAIQSLNKVPAARHILKPLFTFFGNLDDFWLYIYHPRNYEFVITSTFSSIQDLETQKWNIIPYQTLWGYLGIDTTSLKEIFSSKLAYTNPKFLQVQGNSNGFFINTANFFLSNMLITILVFLTCRFFFFLLFNFKVSIFLRQYSFWPYLAIILMDGNLQFASYLVAFEFRYLFFPDFPNKLLIVWVLTTFFAILVFAIGSYFLFRYMYGQLAKYFFDNSKNSNLGAFYMMTQAGLRNILLGFVHFMDFQDYTHKIAILFILESVFLVFGLNVVSIANIFQHKINAWINLTAQFLRIIIISIFYFEQNIPQPQSITLSSPIFVHLIGLYILIGASAVFVEVSKLLLGILGFLKPKDFQKLQQMNQVHEVVLKNHKKLKITVMNVKKQQRSKAVKIITREHLDLQKLSYKSFDFQDIPKIDQIQNIDLDNRYDKLISYKQKLRRKLNLKKRQDSYHQNRNSEVDLHEIQLNVTPDEKIQKSKTVKYPGTIVNMKRKFKKKD